MVRKLWATALALIMLMGVIPLTAAAEAVVPAAFGAPEHFAVSHYMADSVYYTFSAPVDMRAYIDRSMADDPDKQTFSINFQIDYKIDGGGWHHTSAWDSPATAPSSISDRYLVFSGGRYYHSSDRWGLTEFFPEDEAFNAFYETGRDYLKSHSITFRGRFAESYDGGESYVLSPWSEEYTLSASGKADYNKLINQVPTLLSAEVKMRGSEPYFDVKTGVIPGEIQDLNAMSGGAVGVQIWMRRAGEEDFKKIEPSDPLAEGLDVEASEYFDDGQQNYDQESYEIKVRYELDLRSYKQAGYADSTDSVYIYSPFSNVISHNMPAWSNASTWATEELKKADDAGLIPGILKSADLTKPITREEFCELALLLYEKTIGESPAPVSPNPFTDTENPQILKAFALGITQGTSATTFSPEVLINREQCATMLFRTIKTIHPKGDYSVANIPDFPDQKSISSFAVDGTKFMSKLGIIKGDNNGDFMPKSTTAAQTAAGYGMATREAAVLMSVRTYDRMDDIQSSESTTPQEQETTETRLNDSLVTSGAVKQSDADAAKIGESAANSGGQFGLQIPSGLAAPNVHNQTINVANDGCQIVGTMSVSDFRNYCSQVQASGFTPPPGESGIQETDYVLEFFATRGDDEIVHFILEKSTPGSTEGDVTMSFGIG